MERALKGNKFKIIVAMLALTSLSLLGVGSGYWAHTRPRRSLREKKCVARRETRHRRLSW